MTEQGKIVLPVFNDREFTEQFKKDTLELSEQFKTAIENILRQFENVDNSAKPSAYAIGAAVYTALWRLAEPVDEKIRDAMLSTCFSTMAKNDPKFQLAMADLPSTPN